MVTKVRLAPRPFWYKRRGCRQSWRGAPRGAPTMYSRARALPDRRQRLRLLWLIAALWTLFVAGAAAWAIGERVRDHREQTWSNATVRLLGVKDTLSLTFQQLAALPKSLAHWPSVSRFLSAQQRPESSALNDPGRLHLRAQLLGDHAVQAMDAQLDQVAADFGLQLVLLVDQRGNTVANGIADKARQPTVLGSNLRDRDYFVRAMRDGKASQFLLGRLSRVPGLYFAHRVKLDGQALGIAVIKQDSETLNRLLADAAGNIICVTDANGVVVLGNRTSDLLRRLSDPRAQTPQEWDSVYQHVPEPMNWRMSTMRIAGRPVTTAEWGGRRHLAVSAPLDDRPFTVWVLAQLDDGRNAAVPVGGTAAAVWLVGCLLIWGGWRRLQLLDSTLQARRDLLDMAQALPLTVFRYREPAGGGPGRFAVLGRGVRELFGVDASALADDPTLPWRLAHSSRPSSSCATTTAPCGCWRTARRLRKPMAAPSTTATGSTFPAGEKRSCASPPSTSTASTAIFSSMAGVASRTAIRRRSSCSASTTCRA
jgi:hypothetical protein